MGSRRELIVEALREKLRQVDGNAPWNTNLTRDTAVQLEAQPENRFRELPMVAIAVEREGKSTDTNIDMQGQLTISMLLVPDQGPQIEGVTAVDEIVTDVERVLLRERQEDPPLGVPGVIDMDLDGFALVEVAADRMVGAQMEITVRYRHDIDDPSTFRGVA